MRAIGSLVIVIGLGASALGQGVVVEPAPVDRPQQQVPGQPPLVNQSAKCVAQAVADEGNIILQVSRVEPKEVEKKYVAYFVKEPVEELRDDGEGGKRKVTYYRHKASTRTYTQKMLVRVSKRYSVIGNKSLVVRTAGGATLCAEEVKAALQEPVDVYEFTDKPDAAFLQTLAPETVVLVWADDAARAASELPDIAEQSNAADSR